MFEDEVLAQEKINLLSDANRKLFMSDCEKHALENTTPELLHRIVHNGWELTETEKEFLWCYAVAVAMHVGRDLPPPIPSHPEIRPWSETARNEEIAWQHERFNYYLGLNK